MGSAEPGAAVRGRRITPAARARVLLFFAAALFGLLAVLARIASLEGLTAPQVATVRFAVGTAVALALFRIRPGTFRPVRRGLLVTRGLLGGLAALLYFYALSLIPAGQATLLNNTFPVIAVAISYFTLGERPTWHLLLALGVTSLGVFLVIGGGAVGLHHGVGAVGRHRLGHPGRGGGHLHPGAAGHRQRRHHLLRLHGGWTAGLGAARRSGPGASTATPGCSPWRRAWSPSPPRSS